ncbi:uncharacterized protein LOC129587483 [Paramacrobiotus metropolitanus]|uniref:uncharacterized protein LOC129587483 n=1 Tax=Paramacrobiotus metropolitanus TaxID=2943436 RepID=UPI002445BB55|nr:uncharacterized protein LOC129587483 [Paramacrobiotus metropolitanus]
MAQSLTDVSQQMELESYKKHRISVVTGSDNRFEGWLKDVFPDSKEISLEKVRFCGTESRRTHKSAPARLEVYSCIRLQLSEAKEIFAHIQTNPEVIMDSAVLESGEAVVPILWHTVRLPNNKEAVILPSPPDRPRAAGPTLSTEGALLDIPIALEVLAEHTRRDDKPQASFISRAQIRYEGTLKHLDESTRTVSLHNVRFLGTENRPSVKQVAPRAEVYPSVKFQLDQIRNIRITVAMCKEMAEDSAVLIDETSSGVIELDATSASPLVPPFGDSQGNESGQAETSSQNDLRRRNARNAAPPRRLQNSGGLETIKTRKARTYSRSGNKKYGTTKRTPLRPPAPMEPSSSDNSDERAASLHSNSNSTEDAPKPAKTKGRKRSVSYLPPKGSAASRAKRSRQHSETNVRKSVVTAQESLDEPMYSQPVLQVDTSDVVRDAMEPDSGKLGDIGVNGNTGQDSDGSAQVEERKEPIVFDVKWDAKKARCPVPNCSVPNYLSMSMYTMHQHFRKEHLKQYPKYQLRLHCSLCSENGFNGGQIPDLRRHMEQKHGWSGWSSNGNPLRDSIDTNENEVNGSMDRASGEEAAAVGESMTSEDPET